MCVRVLSTNETSEFDWVDRKRNRIRDLRSLFTYVKLMGSRDYCKRHSMDRSDSKAPDCERSIDCPCIARTILEEGIFDETRIVRYREPHRHISKSVNNSSNGVHRKNCFPLHDQFNGFEF